MEEATLDFDRFMAEKACEYVAVKVYGRLCRVRREIPALLPMLLARAAEISPEEMGRAMLRTGDMLFGPEQMDEFCRQGMTAGEMTALVERTLALICGKPEAGDAETLEDDGSGPAEREKAPAKK